MQKLRLLRQKNFLYFNMTHFIVNILKSFLGFYERNRERPNAHKILAITSCCHRPVRFSKLR